MSEREASPNYRNHNPTGKNQHKDCPPADDATVVRLLHEYHRKGIINKEKLSEIFKTVHGINISATTINRRKRKLGLYASAVTTRDTPDDVKLQLVLDAMAQDPERKMGARRIREAIFARTGTMLTRYEQFQGFSPLLGLNLLA
ncbi:hypothetical protein OBBRIDRAFT_724824 [Obba rivulosa]|uniref:Transposase n=1 Tax=Obba rivulosa TaxID=1052685 RepID=A0A8E2DPU8_9APHY|nr:hypothetical protein OBBRIDRAFT_724824 [Obba rivulosa]